MTRSRDAAIGLLKTLRNAGFESYFAGGCVRDALLGLTPKDYDIATGATPDQVARLLPHCRMVGKAFGVVLSQPAKGVSVEIATFRTDGTYTDGRRPDAVVFTDAKGDAQRRDFTINGLFADPLAPHPDGSDRVIDFVGGQEDLKKGVIRAIGNPEERFGEDFLRLLRAVRFASRLNFSIEERTWQALQANAPKLNGIARERIGDEVRRMMSGPRFAAAAQLLEKGGLAGLVLGLPASGAFTPMRLARLTPEAAYPARLMAWLHDRGDRSAEENLVRVRTGLNLTNGERDSLAALPPLLARAAGWDDLGMAARKRLLAEKEWPEAQRLLEACQDTAGLANAVARDARLLAEDGIGISPTPFLTGGVLMALGLAPGPRFKHLLDAGYDLQLEGKLSSKTEAQAWAAQN